MAVFIVCEFDPFHYGHEYLISEARRLFPGHTVVCVMSGNFVQRGNPALYDEYARARCAIEGGADIVLSLPFPPSASRRAPFPWRTVCGGRGTRSSSVPNAETRKGSHPPRRSSPLRSLTVCSASGSEKRVSRTQRRGRRSSPTRSCFRRETTFSASNT